MSTLHAPTPTIAPIRTNGPSPHSRGRVRKGADNGSLAQRAANDEGAPERIRARAYEIFQARQETGTPGDAASDWLRAQQECGCGDRTPGLNLLPGEDPPLIDIAAVEARLHPFSARGL